MPRLNNLPALEVIRGLKGILDFYYWKGIPCVRKWPVIPPSNRTPASLASAALFGAVVQGYSLLGGALKLLFSEDAADHPRTTRDIYVSAVLGHLHEINMDEVIALLEQTNAYLLIIKEIADALASIGTDLLITLPANDGDGPQQLLVDAERHLQADILASALPTDAATAPHQITQNTALALIAKLENALATVHTDQLIVRSQDQLWSFKDTLWDTLEDPDTAAGNIELTGPTPPADELWIVTNLHAYHVDGAPSRIEIYHGTVTAKRRIDAILTPTSRLGYSWAGQFQQVTGLEMIARFFACAEHSSIYFNINGYKMTRET